MVRPAPLRSALAAAAVLAVAAAAAPRTVDHRYAPATWHTALGLPDDGHKPLADDRGAWLGDFGPGPYALPLTTVGFTGPDGAALPRLAQTSPDARVPLVVTTLGAGAQTATVTTFAVPPARSADTGLRFDRYERLDGVSGALGWAQPAVPCSPEFRNVAWGTNRPIRYRVRVGPGARHPVALGFCESYKPRLGERIALMTVEGAPPQTADLVLTAPRHHPQVFLFAAEDADRDGWLGVTVSAPPGADPNTTLASIALYAPDAKPTREQLIAGALDPADPALLRIACGTESLRQPARTDAVHAVFPAGFAPTLTVRTGRTLREDTAGGLALGDRPFVRTRPRAERIAARAGSWVLHFPAGTIEATALVFSGETTAADADAALAAFDFSGATAQLTARWAQAAVPFARVQLGDPAVQRVFDAALRTLWQASERIDGQEQFNSSFTLYRGLWAGDAVYFVELAALLGDFARARATLDTIWSWQNAHGLIDEMPPLTLYRTTPAAIWAVERYAQLAGDRATLERLWPAVLRAVAALRAARDRTLADPAAANAGLLPAGFNDGGIAEIGAEYSSVYWTLTGVRAAARAGRRLGKTADAAAAEQFATELLAAFQRAAQRDLRTAPGGHRYLPVRVGFTGEDPVPQLAQWAVLEHHLFGDSLPLDGPLLQGTLALLADAERQGLPHSTGWMRDGIWAGYGSLYAHLPLLLGRHEKAADLLYAVANHASPTGGWVEEQSALGAPPKTAGDQPHAWAASLFVRHALAMLAAEHRGTVHLLLSTPPEWLRPGARNALDRIATDGGPLSLGLDVSPDSRTATLAITAPPQGSCVLHTASLRAAGFAPAAGSGLGEKPHPLPPGTRTVWRFGR